MRHRLALALATASLYCFSQDTAGKSDCGESQRQANECARKGFAIADRKLNRMYREVMGRIPPKSKVTLRTDQRRWLKELEPKCDAENGPRETAGAIWPMEFYNCMATAASARTKIVEAWGSKK